MKNISVTKLATAAMLTVVMTLSATSAFGETIIGARRNLQQQRIAQGVQNGTLNAGQTAHLESREAALNREVRANRAANGGVLTAAQRAQVNRQQNRLSHAIYADKHK
jgi:hypothetical protein